MTIIKTITHSYDGGQTVIKTEMTPFNLFVLNEEKGDHNGQGEAGNPVPLSEMGDNTPKRNIDYEAKAVVVSKDYIATSGDYYIGVHSDAPVTIILSGNFEDSHKIIVKSEMRPPLGNRKITIKCDDDGLIDGSSEYVIQTSYDSVTILYRDNDWFIIS
jgi:hypothetical protein